MKKLSFTLIFGLVIGIVSLQAAVPVDAEADPIAILAQHIYENNMDQVLAALGDSNKICDLAYEELSFDVDLLRVIFPELANQYETLDDLRAHPGENYIAIAFAQMRLSSALATKIMAIADALHAHLVQLNQPA